MTETENIVIAHLRHIRDRVDRIGDDVDDLKSRLSSLEHTVAGVRRDLAHMYGEVVEQHARYDGIAKRVDRIEQRLELQD
jgi:tetrahydromethanopterin S-methyltransferase subunit G